MTKEDDIEYIFKLFFDGACPGNGKLDKQGRMPRMGMGAVIYQKNDDDEDVEIAEITAYGKRGTNNEAEYKALIYGLKYLYENKKITKERYPNIGIEVYGDSMCVIKQIKGEWNVKAENLIPLYLKANYYKKRMNLKFKHIRREYNSKADELANEGVRLGIEKDKKNKN